ncbi:MAG: sensor histidine kinase, partial [Christensenellaceae bacterium]
HVLYEMLYNLVDNAIKYTPVGSEIVIRAVTKGKTVEVSIADDGPGIPDEAKARIFDMFYTAKATKAGADSRRGLGLGLALCRSIITAHGGTIAVEDNHPHGTIFRFTLQAEEVSIHE